MSEKQDKTVNTAMSECCVLGHLMLMLPGGWNCCQPYITTGKLRQRGTQKMEPASSDSALREGLSKWPRNSSPLGMVYAVLSGLQCSCFPTFIFWPQRKKQSPAQWSLRVRAG